MRAFASYMRLMFTTTATEARAGLSALLRKALDGQEIGIVCHSWIVALRPVEVTATDYAGSEYGITANDLQNIAKSAWRKKAKKAVKTGQARAFDGDIEKAIWG